MNIMNKETVNSSLKLILLILTPREWPTLVMKLLQFLTTRAVILIYCGILYFLIARSSNLQIIGAFEEVSQSWMQALSAGIIALSATMMFALRRPHNPIIMKYFDLPVYLAPLLVMIWFPPWGMRSWGGALQCLCCSFFQCTHFFECLYGVNRR